MSERLRLERPPFRLDPACCGGDMRERHASASIAKRIEKETGMRITAHQFRHAAAALILRAQPGNYEFVRRVLGHLNVQTTIRFYIGLEGFRAGEHYGRLIEERLKSREEDDK